MIGVICRACHKFTSDQPKPGVFRCVPCGQIFEEGSVSCKSMGKHIDVSFPVEKLEPCQ